MMVLQLLVPPNLKRSIYVALHHPLLGIGMNNYTLYSDNGLATHNAYTQVGVELGLAAMVFIRCS